MIETIADIELLSLRCRSDQSKEYIGEAIRCYKSGAYRAAIVSTWIAVVFDLIDKVRELAVSGDAAAKALEMQHESYITQIERNNPAGIKSALEFEREILETCRRQLQFFDPQQFTDLMRLREDRHRCAHPSFQKVGVPYYPSAEQARVHIRNAIAYVLALPPVQGKAALAQLRSLVSSAYFPTETKKAVAQLQNSEFRSASEALVRGFVDQLIFGYVNKDDSLYFKDQVISAVNASVELYPALVEDRLRKQLNKVVRDVPDEQFAGVVAMVAFVSIASSILEKTSIDKIVKFVEDGPSAEVLYLFEALSNIECFRSALHQRVNQLTLDELSVAINDYGIGDLAKERAFHFLSEVRSWDRANDVLSKTILPLFSSLSREDIERIIRMPTDKKADLPGAHAYNLFIEKVRQLGLIDETTLNKMLSQNGAIYLVPQPPLA